MSITFASPLRQFQCSRDFTSGSFQGHVLTTWNAASLPSCPINQNLSGLLKTCNSPGGGLRCLPRRKPAVDSGLEASITDPKENTVTVKNAKIVVESQDDDKIQVKVDLNGEETQKVFDKVLTNLARTAPPIPGFRREKGGKTTKVPKSFLLQILGEERVTKFVIQEIVSSTIADYVKTENLKVKDNKTNTAQTAEELKSSFSPGKEFGFNAILELQKSKNETAT